MKQRKTFISLLFGMCASLATATTIAENQIKLHHSVTASQINSISLSLVIDNTTAQDLINVTLIPTGDEFRTQENIQNILVGNLMANSQITIDWTAPTSMPETYFQVGAPLFFTAIGTNAMGENVEIQTISMGAVQ